MLFKTGLLPSPHPPALHFRSYMLRTLLPSVPAVFGHHNVYPKNGWLMLDNDRIGDCTVAGAMHCSMLWNKIAGKAVRFTDLDAQEDYSAITGYHKDDPASDTGADMVAVAKYWQQTGFRDSHANRHKIAVYMAVDPKHLDRVFAAAYLFDAVGLGVQVRQSDETNFIDGHPWTGASHDPVVGYHYVPLIGRLANGNAVVVTWGGAQEVQHSWLEANLREVVAMISPEALVNGKSSEGFDFAGLIDDLKIIASSP
jgi:hypothetical protein